MSKRSGEAILLSTRMLADQGYLATVFSAEHGLVRGLVRKVDGLCSADTVRFEHTRRLQGQLGRLNVEVAVSRAALMFTSPMAALVAGYVAEVCHHVLPEDHPYPELYTATLTLWHGASPWWQRVAVWERMLLGVVGYGLSLEDDPVPCPMGEQLMYVSPVSGRAVSAHVGAPYASRLLALPHMWGGPEVGELNEIRNALNLTGSFLGKALHGKQLTARARLVEHLLTNESQPHAYASDASDKPVQRQRYG